MPLKITRLARAAALRRSLSRLAEPHLMFPAIAVLLLAVIWGATLNLIKAQRQAAQRTAVLSCLELGETYEAQVLRAVREIDQTLKFVKYAYEGGGKRSVLQQLRASALLPPDLLFTISIADANGDVMASTRPSEPTQISERESFRRLLQSDTLSVGRPRQRPNTTEWTLEFGRRLNAADGGFAGVVLLAVDAAYFVSGYESSKLGKHGVLGLLGTDGVFRARRSGDSVSAGDRVDYASVVSSAEAQDRVGLASSAWDGVRRYTSARQLYDFPLAVVVGLSAEEQMAGAERNARIYLWRAFAASLVVVLVVAALGGLSSQLARTRQRALDEQIAHAARVEYLAYHDGLTALPNRSLFSKLLNQGISQARRYDRRLAVLFLDLDRFKHINDTLGHEAGDELLKEVAKRLRNCVRESDTVARLGGDEFVVLLPELDVEKYAATVAQKILSAVARPFLLLGREFRVTASIGISTYPQDGPDEETLRKNADIAMYQAKSEGKNNFQFYSEKLNAYSLQRLTLESGLRHALERNEFRLHYQVKRDVRSDRVTGVEALLRWQHPDLGMVAPMQFIPVAEETGLIVPIGKWVLRSACQQHAAWRQRGLPRLSIAVNLTSRQFSDERLVDDLTAILADTGMDPNLLELEITESLLMRDVEKNLQMLKRLKDIGVRIAIDDFGIGYSLLSTLKQFPLDTVKIDRSFIRDVTSVPEDQALTEAIIAMGRSLGLTVVAQGVETAEQADYLRQNACDQFQGFYVSRPVPADQIAELLHTRHDTSERA